MANLGAGRYRQYIIALKEESTYGVDAFGGTYTNNLSETIAAEQIVPSINMEEIEILATAGLLGRAPSAIGRETASLRFEMPLRGKGAVYTAGTVMPEAIRVLESMGLAATFSASTWQFQPAAPAAQKSFTYYCVGPTGVSTQLLGCHATGEFTATAGNELRVAVTVTGMLDTVENITYVAGQFAATPQYPVAKTAGFQIGTANYAARFSSMRFAMNNQLQYVPSFNAASGVAGVFIADRNPRLEIDPEDVAVATFDWFTAWKFGVLQDVSFNIGAAGVNNRISFSFNPSGTANLQITGRDYFQRDGLMAARTNLLATIASGEDDFRITYAA
jgi:hypothetical protein